MEYSFFAKNDFFSVAMFLLSFPKSPRQVNYGAQIGQGQFGIVYKGSWKGYTVAIKTMREGSVNSDDFFDEAKIMMRFKHANLIR